MVARGTEKAGEVMNAQERYLAFRVRFAHLLADLPSRQAEEVRCFFDEFVGFNAELLKGSYQVNRDQEQAIQQRDILIDSLMREVNMWRQAEADWWNSRVSRETALFEDRLPMVQSVLGEEMIERLVEAK